MQREIFDVGTQKISQRRIEWAVWTIKRNGQISTGIDHSYWWSVQKSVMFNILMQSLLISNAYEYADSTVSYYFGGKVNIVTRQGFRVQFTLYSLVQKGFTRDKDLGI